MQEDTTTSGSSKRTPPPAETRGHHHQRKQENTTTSGNKRTPLPAAARGKPLKDIYAETYAKMQPQFGEWVIFDHCMPFDVSRAFDEASGHDDPRIWTAERDVEMWKALEQGE